MIKSSLFFTPMAAEFASLLKLLKTKIAEYDDFIHFAY